MEFIKYIFSDFWIFCGFVVILSILCGTVVSIIDSIKK